MWKNFWSCFCLADKYWSFLKLEFFTCNIYWTHSIVHFFGVVCCVSLLTIEPQNSNSKKPWLKDQLFKYQTLLPVLASFQLFRTTFWHTSSVVFLKVSIMYPIKAQMSLRAFDFFKIFDLNWQVRMCCEVPLRLCI